MTYARISGAKKLTVDKSTGAVTVKKGTKKGKYRVKIKVTAAGDNNHLEKTVTLKATIRVR